jgi:diadenosine tetraphosphatase ApaH/serine/threonine PP2A family protein phosphatase
VFCSRQSPQSARISAARHQCVHCPGTGSGHRSRYPLLRPHPRPLCAQLREQFPHPQSGCSIQSATPIDSSPSTHPPATPVPTLKRIINAGSVGEPRHGRPNATYVLYDTASQAVTLREVEYDYAKTCAAIIEKGLPAIFAWRLAQGLEYAEKADDPSRL